MNYDSRTTQHVRADRKGSGLARALYRLSVRPGCRRRSPSFTVDAWYQGEYRNTESETRRKFWSDYRTFTNRRDAIRQRALRAIPQSEREDHKQLVLFGDGYDVQRDAANATRNAQIESDTRAYTVYNFGPALMGPMLCCGCGADCEESGCRRCGWKPP